MVHAQPGATLTVVRGNLARTVTSATADANGGMIFRQLIPGPDYRVVLPASAFAGAAFLVLADALARVLFRGLGAEPPVGAVTAMVGAPLFVMLLRRRA